MNRPKRRKLSRGRKQQNVTQASPSATESSSSQAIVTLSSGYIANQAGHQNVYGNFSINQFNSHSAQETERRQRRQKLLQSLKYPNMHARRNTIESVHSGTNEWIFDDSKDRPWDSFTQFLKSLLKLYWIQGKAGSGKSSLMKFILEHDKTKELLQIWASQTGEVIILSYFFWLSGSILEKSLKGMWCSFLFELLESRPILSDRLLERHHRLVHKNSVVDWAEEELTSTVLEVVELTQSPCCIFIDGLDEFDDLGSTSLHKVVESLCSRKTIKVIISSRPEARFQVLYSKTPQLRVQDLNRDDIQMYIQENLREAVEKCIPDVVSNEQLERLGEMMIARAEGVFLWVRYVVRSLEYGLISCNTWEELRDRLEECPSQMHGLYSRMLSKVHVNGEATKTFAAQCLQFALFPGLNNTDWSCNLFMLTAYLDLELQEQATENSAELDNEAIVARCNRTRLRLSDACAGLLEARLFSTSSSLYDCFKIPVQFFHRSARDFISSTQDGLAIARNSGRSTEAFQAILFRAFLVQLRVFMVLNQKINSLPWDLHRCFVLLAGLSSKQSAGPVVLEGTILLVKTVSLCLGDGNRPCDFDGWNLSFYSSQYFALHIAGCGDVFAYVFAFRTTNFVGMAASYGLVSFVQAYLDSECQQRRLNPEYLSSVLHDAIRSLLRLPGILDWEEDHSYIAHVKDPLKHLISTLLKYGADPTIRGHCFGLSSTGSLYAQCCAIEMLLFIISTLRSYSRVLTCVPALFQEISMHNIDWNRISPTSLYGGHNSGPLIIAGSAWTTNDAISTRDLDGVTVLLEDTLSSQVGLLQQSHPVFRRFKRRRKSSQRQVELLRDWKHDVFHRVPEPESHVLLEAIEDFVGTWRPGMEDNEARQLWCTAMQPAIEYTVAKSALLSREQGLAILQTKGYVA